MTIDLSILQEEKNSGNRFNNYLLKKFKLELTYFTAIILLLIIFIELMTINYFVGSLLLTELPTPKIFYPTAYQSLFDYQLQHFIGSFIVTLIMIPCAILFVKTLKQIPTFEFSYDEINLFILPLFLSAKTMIVSKEMIEIENNLFAYFHKYSEYQSKHDKRITDSKRNRTLWIDENLETVKALGSHNTISFSCNNCKNEFTTYRLFDNHVEKCSGKR